MSQDPYEEMRRRVAGLSPDELQSAVSAILGGGLRDLVSERHTPSLPQVSEAPPEPRALTVRVDIAHTSPPVWRRLVVRGDLTLDEVHEILQTAFGWTNSHLHRFWPGPGPLDWRGPYFLTDFDLDEGAKGIMEVDVRLDQLLREPGDRLHYTYDFGDDWQHTIALESISALEPDAPTAVCTGGRGAGPLEDCGGPPGHHELVTAFAADPALSTLEDYRREWVPRGWDPTVFDADQVTQQLSLIGLSPDEILQALSQESGDDQEAGWPPSLEALRDLAPPFVTAELARLCVQARAVEVELSAQDLATITAPFRYLVDLAGEEGIPLTSAGWMKPAFVQQTYTDLGFDAQWFGKGNREDHAQPVAELRAMCQQLGLLRKNKGRLLRTKLAQSLTSDADYLGAIAARLLHARHEYLRAELGLFALLTVTTGKVTLDHANTIAELLTSCGLSTGPMGVDHWSVIEVVRPLWVALQAPTGRAVLDPQAAPPQDHRAVALARAALWPNEFVCRQAP